MSLRNIGDCNNRYFREMDRYPERISRDESIELARKAQAGDELAKDRLIGCHLRYVVKEAGKWVRNGRTLDDMIQYGNIGLVRALETFDPDLGFHFLTHARWGIRNEIQRGCSNEGHVCVPNRSYQKDVGSDEVMADRRLAKSLPVELNSAVRHGSDMERVELLVCGEPLPDDDLDAVQLREFVSRTIDSRLKDRQALAVRMRMNGKMLWEIGDELGITWQGASVVVARAHGKLLTGLGKECRLRMGA